MQTYLDKVGSTYYFRRVVPEKLRPYFRTSSGAQRVEFKISLGTKDRTEAKRRCIDTAKEVQGRFDEAERLLKAKPQSPASRSMTEGEFEVMLATSADLSREHFEWEEREKARERVIEIARTDSSATALRDLLDDSLFEALHIRQAHEGQRAAEWQKAGEDYTEQFVRSLGVPLPPPPTSLHALFSLYVSKQKPSPATIKRWKPVIQNLVDFLGEEDAAKLSVGQLREWRDHLLQEVVRNGDTRSPKTVGDTYLAAIKATLNIAVEEGLMSDNPASKVVVRGEKKPQLRSKQFTAEEARIILTATFAHHHEHLSAKHAAARRWVPWLCAYSGARVNEITQMRAEDVVRVDGVWAMLITPEAGSQKANKARLVPLHDHLIEQGFIEFAAETRVGPMFYDPSKGRGGSTANPHYKKVGERLAAWVRDLGVNDPNVQPNHAWRHLFITKARTARLEADARRAIPGHKDRDEHDAYGEKELPYLKGELDKFPRFSIDRPQAVE